MNRGYPAWAAKASMYVAVPLVGLVAINYVTTAIGTADNSVFALGATAFGVTAALAGICFTVPAARQDTSAMRFAGEKFLHAAVLLIQLLMLTYLVKVMAGLGWLGSHSFLRIPATGLLYLLLGTISAMACFTWLQGLDELNTQLWTNWRQRMEVSSAASESAGKPKDKGKGAP